MHRPNGSKFRWLSAAWIMVALAACGGGGGGGANGGGGGGNPPTFTIGVTVTGLKGGMTLRNNGDDKLRVFDNGSFAFATKIASNKSYNVTVESPPSFPAQNCTLANSTGSVGTTDVTVSVTCVDLPGVELNEAVAGAGSVTLRWNTPDGASSFNIYVGTDSSCSIPNAHTCTLAATLPSPQPTTERTFDNLNNEQAYYFAVEVIYANGAHAQSQVVGARPNVLAFNGAVNAIASAQDGTVYLGGDFTKVGLTTGAGVPVHPVTGQPLTINFPMVVGRVLAVTEDRFAGGWYIGGSFTRVGNVPRKNLAYIRGNKTVDPDFHPDPNGEVRALTVPFDGSVVYAGGSFTTVVSASGDTIDRAHLAAFHHDGSADESFTTAIDGDVFALALSSGSLYVGGAFTSIAGGTPTGHLVALNAVGQPDPGKVTRGWSANVQGGDVYAITPPNGLMYVGGTFTQPRHHLAGLNPQTGASFLLQETSGSVHALDFTGSQLFIGGTSLGITDANNVFRDHLAVLNTLNAAGTLDARYADPDGDVYTLNRTGDGTTFVGGNFNKVGGIAREHLAAFVRDGGVLTNFHPDPNGAVYAMDNSTNFADLMYVGGAFTSLGGTSRNRLAALDANGRLLPWNPDADASVSTLAVADHTIYAGGAFTHLGESARGHLAAIDADGTLDSLFPEADGNVNALAVKDGVIFAGGDFSQVGGSAHNRLVRIDANGISDPHAAIQGSVAALSVANNSLYIGGSSLDIADTLAVKHNNFAVIDLLNGSVNPLLPDPNGPVTALAVAGNIAYLGGSFTGIGPAGTAIARNRLAALDPSRANAVVLPWNPNADGAVNALAVTADSVCVGGQFNSVQQRDVGHLTLIEPAINDGTGEVLDIVSPMPNGVVSSIALSGDAIYVGGPFTAIGSKPRGAFAKLDANAAVE